MEILFSSLHWSVSTGYLYLHFILLETSYLTTQIHFCWLRSLALMYVYLLHNVIFKINFLVVEFVEEIINRNKKASESTNQRTFLITPGQWPITDWKIVSSNPLICKYHAMHFWPKRLQKFWIVCLLWWNICL